MTVNREKTLPTALRILRENGGAIRVPHGPQEGREAPGMFSLKPESRSTRPGQDRRRAGQPFPLLACSCPRSWNFLGYPGANRSHFCAAHTHTRQGYMCHESLSRVIVGERF
jgi:hypothetical protein